MIFLYHNVIPDDSPDERLCAGQALTRSVFEAQIQWLASRHRLVSLTEYIKNCRQPEFSKQKPVAVTLDDGFSFTFECISPFLIERNIPVTIFAATGHLEHGDLLWFSYLKAACFEKIYSTLKSGRYIFPLENPSQRIRAWNELRVLAKASGDPVVFSKELAESYPLPEDIIPLYEGMTEHQIRTASQSGLVELGAHTITHPFLNQISEEKQKSEIVESSRVLSGITGKPIRYFAYPAGEYNLDVLNLVKDAGYEAAFAVIPQNLGTNNYQFEIGRVGIYSPSLLRLKLKALGIANLARRFGLRVG